MFSSFLSFGKRKERGGWSQQETRAACIAARKEASPTKFLELAAHMWKDAGEEFHEAAVKAAYVSLTHEDPELSDHLSTSRDSLFFTQGKSRPPGFISTSLRSIRFPILFALAGQ